MVHRDRGPAERDSLPGRVPAGARPAGGPPERENAEPGGARRSRVQRGLAGRSPGQGMLNSEYDAPAVTLPNLRVDEPRTTACISPRRCSASLGTAEKLTPNPPL